MPNKVHSDSKQSIDQREAAEGGARAEAGRMGVGIGENPDGRRRREFGEASSSENERKAGLGPYLSSLLLGMLGFQGSGGTTKEKAQVQHCTALDWTGLAFLSLPSPSLLPSHPTNLSIVA